MSAFQSAAESRAIQNLLDRADRETCDIPTLVDEECLRTAIAESDCIDSRVRLGRFLSRRGRFDEAESVLDEAWQLSRRSSDDVSWRALCCRELAILHRLSGSLDWASRFRQLAIKAELEGQGGPTGVSLWLAACEAREAERYEDAEQLLDASDCCMPRARPADVLAERGRLCRCAGDIAGAIGHLRRSVRLLIPENDEFVAGVILEELGQICCDEQRYRAAAKMLKRAAKLYRRLGHEGDVRRVVSWVREANRCRRLLEAVAEKN